MMREQGGGEGGGCCSLERVVEWWCGAFLAKLVLPGMTPPVPTVRVLYEWCVRACGGLSGVLDGWAVCVLARR
jgi:hypothetical protein